MRESGCRSPQWTAGRGTPRYPGLPGLGTPSSSAPLTMRCSATLAVALVLVLALCSAAPRYDEESKGLADRDVQMWRDTTMQILQQLLRSNGDFGPIYHHKRNSEIINSLLGIPKTMAENGR
ncbi:pigment-dispersing hormone type 1-like [Thrips palmi]|uniref:Pigment-dispersing hormone type 1-like n=1 Tax=Thrips palmi TaxID=161013 RepID=A0A6P8Z9H1_THRPL|nr:pigment-dispersing hormone type 1-like [Thrips palmi]